MPIAGQDQISEFQVLKWSVYAGTTMYVVFAGFGRGSQGCLIHAFIVVSTSIYYVKVEQMMKVALHLALVLDHGRDS